MKENFTYGLTRVCGKPANLGKATASYSTAKLNQEVNSNFAWTVIIIVSYVSI
jgi:hypothetical protein